MQLTMYELQILAAITRLGDQAYAVRIEQEVERVRKGKMSPAQIYTLLKKLRAKRVVQSWRMPAPKGSRGPNRRVYALTDRGSTALAAASEAIRRS